MSLASSLPIIRNHSSDDKFWKKIKRSFPDSSSNILNLNNGSAGMMPSSVESYTIDALKKMNRLAPYMQQKIWTDLEQEILTRLSTIIGAEQDEICLTRNTTESFDLIYNGIALPKGSDIVISNIDYPYAINAFRQLVNRKALELNQINLNLPADYDSIIAQYDNSITEKTALVLITSITHRSGFVMPVKEIASIAKSRGAEVIVDAAHSFGLQAHNVKAWDCDYYCTSLHKWFSAPHGNGLLYIKKNNIASIKGPYAADHSLDDSMKKFNYNGTRSFYSEISIFSALEFLDKVGIDKKKNRLEELTSYWTKEIQKINGVVVQDMKHKIAMNTFYVKGKQSAKLKEELMESAINVKKVKNHRFPTEIRVSPNIYHDKKDLDRFLEAVEKCVR